MKRDIGTIIIGTLFLIAGILIGGSILGIFDFRINFAGWWTVFIIVPALIAIVQTGFTPPALIMLSVGTILLLDAQNVIPGSLSWRLILPIILLIVGFNLLFGNNTKRSNGKTGAAGTGHGTGAGSGASYKSATAIFGGQDILYPAEEFSGAAYSAIFGGCTINLRNVHITGEAVISVTALFGGIDLILPDNVQAFVNVTPILGGADCKYVSSQDPLSPKIVINGTATFGGIDIK